MKKFFLRELAFLSAPLFLLDVRVIASGIKRVVWAIVSCLVLAWTLKTLAVYPVGGWNWLFVALGFPISFGAARLAFSRRSR